MRIVLASFTVAAVWLCAGTPTPRSPIDGTVVAEHVGQNLTWDCGYGQDTLRLDRDGGFAWSTASKDGSGARVEGTWALVGSSGVGVTLDVTGTRADISLGEPPSEAEAFEGTVHIAPIRELPEAGVVRELDRWRGSCVRELDPVALVDAAAGVDALAMRGDLSGLFHR